MNNVVVIGANGFIGSHLVDALAQKNSYKVTAFDRFSSNNFNFDSKNVNILRGDFLNRTSLEEAVKGQDLVFHFLSTTTPATAQSDPTLDIRTNVIQSVELLEACVKHGVKHVYFASTGGAIYGLQHQEMFREVDQTLPVSPYAIGKLCIENYLRFFNLVHGLNSTILRISNPYGPRQKTNQKQGFIAIALNQMLQNQPVIRFGDGSMIRDFIYVDDVVSMILRMVEGPISHDIYNIGSGVGHSVNEVLETMRLITGREIQLDTQPIPGSYVDRVVLDNSRYFDEFGPMQLTDLEVGIRRTYDFLGKTK